MDVVTPTFGPAASENGVTVIPADSYLQESNTHGGSAGGRDETRLPVSTQLSAPCCFVACNSQDVCDFLVLSFACSNTPITAGKERT